MKAAIQGAPRDVGINLGDWNWKVVRQYVRERFRVTLGRSSCLNYLHRLGFVLKRPKKRLLKAKAAAREAFVACYAKLRLEAEARSAKIFFADEAHFRADADLRVSGFSEANQRWWTPPVPGGVRRPVTTRQSAWRLVRWK